MATGKRTTKGLAAAGAVAIPTKPRVVCLGELMSREFSDGAFALRDVLVEVGELIHEDDAYLNNEHRSSLHFAARIAELIDRGGDFRAGVIAATANWLVPDFVDASESPATGWVPFKSLPAFDGNGWDEPHRLAMLFEVAGDPVTVTPDLVALRWGALDDDVEEVSVELVRAIGRPISRRRFDAMRERLAA